MKDLDEEPRPPQCFGYLVVDSKLAKLWTEKARMLYTEDVE